MLKKETFQEVFVDLLAKYPWRNRFSMADLELRTGIPKKTLANWKEGRVRRPHQWQGIVKLAIALRCTKEETNALLTSATHPTIAELWEETTTDEDKELLEHWPRPKTTFSVKLKLDYFAGRTEEKLSLTQWLEKSEYDGPLLISGMPGVGKTALANQIAHELEPVFYDGVILVDIPSLDSMTLLNQLASGLGGHDLSEQHGLNSRSQAFRNILIGKRALLILDNASSYLDIQPFLPHTPSTTAVIITTRQKTLDITHTAYPLHIKPFKPEEALALFANILGTKQIQQAKTKTALAKIAEMVGYLPLALAIAAGHIKEWGVESVQDYLTLLQQEDNVLNHLHEESRNVRWTFETSYKRLSQTAQLQQFFVALGAFYGQDFDIAAAAHVVKQQKLRTKNMLIKLRALSLLEETTPERFRLHDLLRSYARSKQIGIATVQRMVAYYATYAVDYANDFPSLTSEISNIQAALDIATRENTTESIFAITFPYARFLLNDGQFHNAQTRLEFALSTAINNNDMESTCVSYEGLGRTAAYQGDFPAAERQFRAGLDVARSTGLEMRICDFLQNISSVKLYQNQLSEAEETLQEGLALARKLDYRARIGPMLSNLASLETKLGHWAQAKEYLEQALEVARTADDLFYLVNILSNLSATEIELGEYAAAEAHLAEVLEKAEDKGNNEVLIRALRNFAELHKEQGHTQVADDYYQQALDIARDAGNYPLLLSILNDWGKYLFDRQAYKQAEEMFTEIIETAAPEDFPEFVRTSKFGQARILATKGDSKTARQLAEEALALCEGADEKLAQEIQEWLSHLPDEAA